MPEEQLEHDHVHRQAEASGGPDGPGIVEVPKEPVAFLFTEPEPSPPPEGSSVLDAKYQRMPQPDGSVKIRVTRIRHEPDGTVTVLGYDEVHVPADEVRL